ncbi:MAG: hypothetical protein QGF00_02175, partial [Planctomycetota bacterium]|nr:hypothetical protein [Planctomycetota bacterium]
LGRGVQRWLNPAWDLLIYFTPQPGRDYEVYDRSLENVWQAVPLRLSQRYRGLPKLGQPIHFTTLLWPHKPELDVDKYVNRIHILRDDPKVTGFRVDLTDQKSIFLGINDSGKEATCGEVTTDASVFVLTCGRDGKSLKPGHLFAVDVSAFSLSGKAVHQSEEQVRVDRGL